MLILGTAGNDALEDTVGDDTILAGADHFDFVYMSNKQGNVTITDLELGIDEITFNGRDAVEAYFLGLATLEETDTGAVLSYGRCGITLAGVSVADIADWYYTLQPDDEPIDVPVYTG